MHANLDYCTCWGFIVVSTLLLKFDLIQQKYTAGYNWCKSPKDLHEYGTTLLPTGC